MLSDRIVSKLQTQGGLSFGPYSQKTAPSE
jgi:hypothetical protein